MSLRHQEPLYQILLLLFDTLFLTIYDPHLVHDVVSTWNQRRRRCFSVNTMSWANLRGSPVFY